MEHVIIRVWRALNGKFFHCKHATNLLIHVSSPSLPLCPLPVLSHTASAILYLPSMPYLFPINPFTLPSHPLYILPLPNLCSLAVLFLTYMYVPPSPSPVSPIYITYSYLIIILIRTCTHTFFPPPSPLSILLVPLPLLPSHLCTYLLGTAAMDDGNEGSGMGRHTGEGKEKQFQVARPVQGMDRIMTQCHTP